MTRSGEPSVAELMAQLAANAAEIAALKAEKEALSARVVKLEEELVLARLHRFAPKSEKHVDRLFNEAEQVADEVDVGEEDGDLVDLPDTGFPSTEKQEGKKRGRKPLPEHLPRERVEYDLAHDQKACPCCRHQMNRMGEAVTEQLHIEVKAKVLQNVRLKYVGVDGPRTASKRARVSRWISNMGDRPWTRLSVSVWTRQRMFFSCMV